MFARLYQRVLSWAKHPHATRYLAVMSFAESSFFPIPPDVLLAPMALAQPKRAWYFAGLTTVTSVLGGIFGYALGYFLFEPLVFPLIEYFHYTERYLQIEQWFNDWGIWIIFIAGFSPIPYKLFTVAAGFLHIALLPFIVASFLGRGARFFLVSALIVWGGDRLKDKLELYINTIGWCCVAILGIIGIVYYLH